MSSEIGEIKGQMEVGFSALQKSIDAQRTPLSQWAGWVSVAVVVIGAILYPLFVTDRRLEAGFERLATYYVEHLKDGHPLRIDEKIAVSQERISAAEKRLDNGTRSFTDIRSDIRGALEKIRSLERTIYKLKEEETEQRND